MKESEKDPLASEVAELRTTLDLALSDEVKYPVQEFRALVKSVRRYIQMTAKDKFIHKSVASAVHGVREFLQVEEKQFRRYRVRGRQAGVPAFWRLRSEFGWRRTSRLVTHQFLDGVRNFDY